MANAMLQERTVTAIPPEKDTRSHEWANGTTKASHNVAWYQKNLSRVPDTARQIFEEYSGIPKDEVVDHIYELRSRAWEILPYPCIGLFRFLDLPACLSPVYPEVLDRIRNGATYLDLGCCFGQDIRKLIFDGAPSANLFGVDKDPRFIDLGYELFKDKGKLQAHLCSGNVFDEGFLMHLRGKIDVIFLGSFLHLFTIEKQRTIVHQVAGLLRDRKNTLVFGRHMATSGEGGLSSANACGWSLYHHSPETIDELWQSAPVGTWQVDSVLVPYASESWTNGVSWQGSDNTKQMYFSARRVS